MEPVLCHTSALEYWRSVRFGSRSFRAVQDARPLLVAPPLKGTLAQPGCWWLKRPLHVLVAESHKRRTSKEVISHIEGNELPSGSILDTCNGFSICSPELCFVQMATMLDLPHLIELGFEWCGTYDTSTDHLRECAPLTSVEKLRTYVESLGPVHGRKKALRALRYALNGSASPRETALAMILHLPYAMGGYGIEAPLLNERVDLSERARRIAGRRYVVCDLLWPRAMLDVEYDHAATSIVFRIVQSERGIRHRDETTRERRPRSFVVRIVPVTDVGKQRERTAILVDLVVHALTLDLGHHEINHRARVGNFILAHLRPALGTANLPIRF